MKKYLNFTLLVFIILIFVRLVYVILIRTEVIDYKKEIPIISIQNVQFNNNKIYVGLADYNRIQVYNTKCNFLNYLKTNTFNKDFWFKVIDEKDNFILDAPIFRKIDTNFYNSNETIISVNRNFPQEIDVVSKDGFSVTFKNNVFDYISFHLVLLTIFLMIFLFIFLGINNKLSKRYN